MLAETGISLPVLSKRVPAQLRFHSGRSDALERLFAERIRHRWPLAIPDPQRHSTPADPVREMIQQLSGGYAESTEFITPHLLTFGDALETECGVTMGPHYAVELQDIVLYVRRLVERLESARIGLGETVLAYLHSQASVCIPGPLSDSEIFSIYTEWRLQGYDDDANAREFLEGEGLEEDELLPMLPSAIRSDLGGEMFTDPQKRLTPRQIAIGLQKAGVEDAKELVQLLTKELPAAREAAHAALTPLASVYWPSEVVNIWLTGVRQRRNSPVWGVVDDLVNNRMQMGDPDYAVAINRVAAPHRYSPRTRRFRKSDKPVKGVDGLKPIALILRAWSAMDRALIILNNYEGLT